MKTLTIPLLVCAVMALTRGAVPQEAPAEHLPVVIQDAPQAVPAGDVPVVIQDAPQAVPAEDVLVVIEDEESPAYRVQYCPGDWTTYKGRCYHYNTNPKTWAQAELDCMSAGGHLASVHSYDEDNVIRSMLLQSGNREAWLGGSDSEEEATWFWSDGSPFFYKRWGAYQPGGGTTQNCITVNNAGQGRWDDKPCSWTYSYVCAINLA